MQSGKIHTRLTWLLQTILLAGVVLAVWEQQWLVAFTTATIILVTLAPLLLGRHFRVFIPPELELLATVFIFASLFLGEVRGYYLHFWWWDIALHTASGFLLGLVGLILVYVLNETEEIHLHMTPGFVALFSFMFAIGIGALWEIFEFSMDRLFGMNMQKPTLSDPSGLTDTMWDMIVNTVGASVISTLGYGFLKTEGNGSFLERWIAKFMATNPRLFNRR